MPASSTTTIGNWSASADPNPFWAADPCDSRKGWQPGTTGQRASGVMTSVCSARPTGPCSSNSNESAMPIPDGSHRDTDDEPSQSPIGSRCKHDREVGVDERVLRRLAVARERVAAVGERADALERRRVLVAEQRDGAHPGRRRSTTGAVAGRVAHGDTVAGEVRQRVAALADREHARARPGELGWVPRCRRQVDRRLFAHVECACRDDRLALAVDERQRRRRHGATGTHDDPLDPEPGERDRAGQIDRQPHQPLVGHQSFRRASDQTARRAGVARVRIPRTAAMIGR